MRHTTIPLFAFAFSIRLSALFATEVTIYPYTSQNVDGKPLVIEEYVTGETLVRPRKWTFAGATYEKRTVWDIPVETNTILEAWIDLDGNGAYDVNEPYGTNAGRDYPEIELSDHGIECTRIDLVADKSDSMTTVDDVLEEAKENTRAYDKEWIVSNKIVKTSFGNTAQRVRIVRWIANLIPIYSHGIVSRVVFDRMITPSFRRHITEADIYSYSGNCDIDFEFLRDEVEDRILGTLEKCHYLVVIGDGKTSWENVFDTNTVHALNSVCCRKFDENWGITKEETMRAENRFGKVMLSWMMNTTNDYYSSYRIVVTNESLHTSYDTGRFRTPARDKDGVMRLSRDYQPGSYLLRISGYNSKFSEDDSRERNFSNWIPFTVP